MSVQKNHRQSECMIVRDYGENKLNERINLQVRFFIWKENECDTY